MCYFRHLFVSLINDKLIYIDYYPSLIVQIVTVSYAAVENVTQQSGSVI